MKNKKTTRPETPTSSESQSVTLADLVLDPELQIRAEMNDAAILDYVAAYESGAAAMPPLVAFDLGGRLHVVDGWHRYHAAQRAGLETVPVEVRAGTRRDALLAALAANTAHGVRRSNADKRRAVTVALDLLAADGEAEPSNYRVAEVAAVSEFLVRKLRESTPRATAIESQSARAGRDGKVRRIPKRPEPASTSEGADDPAAARLADLALLVIGDLPKLRLDRSRPETRQLVLGYLRFALDHAADRIDGEQAERMFGSEPKPSAAERTGSLFSSAKRCPGCRLSERIGCACPAEGAD